MTADIVEEVDHNLRALTVEGGELLEHKISQTSSGGELDYWNPDRGEVSKSAKADYAVADPRADSSRLPVAFRFRSPLLSSFHSCGHDGARSQSGQAGPGLDLAARSLRTPCGPGGCHSSPLASTVEYVSMVDAERYDKRRLGGYMRGEEIESPETACERRDEPDLRDPCDCGDATHAGTTSSTK